MNVQLQNLLDDALGFVDDGGERVFLIEDCVETSGAFVLHHFLKHSLSPHSSDAVIFLSFSQPFSHYDRILRKMGCNLVVQRDNKRLIFFDMLMLDCLGREEGKTSEDLLLALYEKIHKAVEICSSPEGTRNITIIIDDVSLLEVAANCLPNLVLDFLHYCYSLTAQFGCSLITLNHEDIYSSSDEPSLLLQMEYQADVVIKAEPLSTGLATDVHGQLTVLDKGLRGCFGNSGKIRNFQFRIKDNQVSKLRPTNLEECRLSPLISHSAAAEIGIFDTS
ncbi:Elongator complex protein 6 [Forsythia ovata]|uniref:Elongator complex protein 6 n=1 Tax=Forsythia ovata TaxID=205694 RepID=A0ABD1R1U8_9LAMI